MLSSNEEPVTEVIGELRFSDIRKVSARMKIGFRSVLGFFAFL